jgi:hypothetical protein
MKRGIAAFFRYARARHECYLMKQSDPEWATKDPILYKYRFTNVFRELDKTTAWFRKHVRDPMNSEKSLDIMLATVVFRLLNRIEVGEAMFCDDDLLGGFAAFDAFRETGDTRPLVRAIKSRCGKGPYVTGGYIISSPPGYSKLDGMMRVIKGFYKGSREWDNAGAGVLSTMGWDGEESVTVMLTAGPGEYTLESTWLWLRKFDYFGNFHSYEIVTDLRHTYLLDQAPDIMTWANPGPGCRRGANRVMGRDKSDKSADRAQLIQEMQEILAHAKNKDLWPREWGKWEMRDVEHTLCEFDKYERVRNGEGRPRGVYR